MSLGPASGALVTLVLGRLLESVPFGVAPHDLVTRAGSLAGLLLFSVPACLIPVRRIGRVDPVAAMKAD